MKTKGLARFLALVLLLSFCPLWAAARPAPAAVSEETRQGRFDALPFLEAAGCTTVITDLDGVTYTFRGCLDVTALEASPCCEEIASYSVCLNGEALLEVQLRDIQAEGPSLQEAKAQVNGYYSVEFDLDDDQEVFLTGLTPENLSKVQQEILDARLDGRGTSPSRTSTSSTRRST